MRRSRILLTAVAASTAVGLMIAGPASGASAVHYVALGDSYSSGVGAGSYLGSSGSCERSTNAYPQLWANANSPASYVSVACSAATTADVTASQLSALTAATTLVSITVGGNDVNFSGVMEDCVLYSTSTCVRDVSAAENTARTRLPGLLDTVYANIRSAAPNARVVVLGYPRFYDLNAWFCIGLSGTDRAKINEGANVLDGVIQTAVAGQPNFVFADVRSAFAAGHEICDGRSWMHSLNLFDLDESYHPTAGGQSGGYLPAFGSRA